MNSYYRVIHLGVIFLLNLGCNNIYFDLQDADGRTALHVAAWQGYTDIVQARNNKYSALVLIQTSNVG
jgi:ankyrin repeat protein